MGLYILTGGSRSPVAAAVSAPGAGQPRRLLPTKDVRE